jgi:DNA-binding MarR family transcriptional regulator
MNHPIHDLDDVVHQRVRLGILATLIGGDRADFSTLCRGLDVTKGNLGQHLRMLEEAGYVAIDKAFENRRPRTQVSVTQHGRAAFAREGRALRRLLELAESTGTPTPDGATTDSPATNAAATDSAATGSATVQPGAGTQPQSAHVSPGASNQTVGSQANATSVGSSAAVAEAANQVPAPRVEAPQAAQDGTDASNSAQSQRVGFQTGTHPVPDPVA